MRIANLHFSKFLAQALLGFACLAAGLAQAERLKDLASIQGVRLDQLVGYGLVVGLDGSGDQTSQSPFTVLCVASMLQQIVLNPPPGVSLHLNNVAALMGAAAGPPGARPG